MAIALQESINPSIESSAPHANETEKIYERIKPYLSGKGLDIGCGPTPLQFPGIQTVDKNPDFHPTFCCNADRIPVPSSTYDFVYSSHALEHLWFPRRALREWLRVLRPGGFLILHLPHKYFYPNIFDGIGNADHKNDFIPEDIIGMLRKTDQIFVIAVDTFGDKVIPRFSSRIEYRGPQSAGQYSFLIVAEKRLRKCREIFLINSLCTLGYRFLEASYLKIRRHMREFL